MANFDKKLSLNLPNVNKIKESNEMNLSGIKTSKEYFKYVCDQIGEHYESKGFKYSKSRPKISYSKGDIKLVISFWSSRSNELGEYINLEIIPSFFSVQLKNNKEGYLFGHTTIFSKKYVEDKSQIIINKIYGETIQRTDQYSRESVIKRSNSCNVNDFNEYKLSKIIKFIDSKIIYWIEKLKTEEGILELTENIPDSVCYYLRESPNFVEYCQINFPMLNIEKRIHK